MPKTRDEAEASALLAEYNKSGDLSAGDAVYLAIANAIVDSKLAPGRRLREERLADIFQVSRTPIREALMRLETQHLAKRDGRNGLVVAGFDAREIIEIYVLREALDGVAARQTARYGSPADVAALEHANTLLIQATESGDAGRMADTSVRFHQLLASASRNELLQRFVEDIHRDVRRINGTTLAFPGRASAAIREHEEIIAAIRLRDEDGAERAAREHMSRSLAVRILMDAELPS